MSASLSLWYSPPETLELDCGEVHVWRATLDLSMSRVRTMSQTLSAYERTRAEQFRFEKDRMHFFIVHGLLIAILGRYLAAGPRTLQFCYSQYGKPTHSHRLALYAITRSRSIGIDLEHIYMDVVFEPIAEHFFSPYEVSQLRTVPTPMRSETFLIAGPVRKHMSKQEVYVCRLT